jgi:protease IV
LGYDCGKVRARQTGDILPGHCDAQTKEISMLKRTMGLAALIILIMTTSGCIIVATGRNARIHEILAEKSEAWFVSNKVAIIEIEGFISSAQASWFSIGTSVADVKEKLRMAEKDDNVVAVILRIDSPGGSVTASDLIYKEIVKFRKESSKPVVAAFMGQATSGGYYVGCGADEIIATRSCLTGSIGVIMKTYNLQGLHSKLGIKPITIKSGSLKDIGSSSRPMTKEERAILQDLIDEMNAQFTKVVREGRGKKMEQKDFDFISTATIIKAKTALKHNLIDKIGDLDDAIARAKKLAKVKDAHVIQYRARRALNNNIYATTGFNAEAANDLLRIVMARFKPGFYYLPAEFE